MTNLSPRHVQLEEALRLGVESGWYSTKVSGTFVTGPHATRQECSLKIAELNPPPSKRKLKEARADHAVESSESQVKA
ncbi:hypothetical protein [Bradyrhizobium sp. LHD-71]|uniref:hypothetical protein n=1 Tax=Bradyrhizobium sp. LHD-71 TaxID=3072141 RepID=UPI0035BE7F4C